jgi:hypothetical protein
MSVTVKITRKGNLHREMLSGKVRALLEQRAQAAIMAAGGALLEVSNTLVPKDTLALHDTSRVRQEGSGFGAVAVVGYGPYGEIVVAEDRNGVPQVRKPEEYAAEVHERVDIPHPTGGQAKFLLEPAQGTAHSEMREAIKRSI